MIPARYPNLKLKGEITMKTKTLKIGQTVFVSTADNQVAVIENLQDSGKAYLKFENGTEGSFSVDELQGLSVHQGQTVNVYLTGSKTATQGTLTVIGDISCAVTYGDGKEVFPTISELVEYEKRYQKSLVPALSKAEKAELKAMEMIEKANRLKTEEAEKALADADKAAEKLAKEQEKSLAVIEKANLATLAEKEIAEEKAKIEPLVIAACDAIVSNELEIEGRKGKRSELIAGLLATLGYNETNPKAVCIGQYKSIVDYIKRSFRTMQIDVIFDDTNVAYTSIKKQLELQTKTGRLRTIGAGPTGNRNNRQIPAKTSENVEEGTSDDNEEGEKPVQNGNSTIREKALKTVPDEEMCCDLTFLYGSTEKNVKATTLYDFLVLNEDEIYAIIQSKETMLSRFMETLKGNQK